jgi:hypothetical protein
VKYWWVNQNQTYAHEVRGGYLWSPKTNSNGARNHFYDNMLDVRPGDVVLSFCDTYIKAIGVATSVAESSPKPTSFGSAGTYWNNEGWFVEVEFRELRAPIRPREHMTLLEPTLPQRYSPLRPGGDGNQGVYLAELPLAMASRLLNIMGPEATLVIDALEVFGRQYSEDLAAEAQLDQRKDIPRTEIAQLIKARRGQGLFKSRVELVETGCRVTGLRRPAHLIASHIKPWRDATDCEKLDGNNGLLLSPHVDHLFDRRFISFTNTGGILVSPTLLPEVLSIWSIDLDANVGTFSREQSIYLEYHRDVLFRKVAA